jgi:hypothetical protein
MMLQTISRTCMLAAEFSRKKLLVARLGLVRFVLVDWRRNYSGHLIPNGLMLFLTKRAQFVPGCTNLFRRYGPRRVRLRCSMLAAAQPHPRTMEQARRHGIESTGSTGNVTIREDDSAAGPDRHFGEGAIVGRSTSSAWLCRSRLRAVLSSGASSSGRSP